MTTTSPGTGNVETLRITITDSAYAVNAGQVADAILRRLLDGRCLK